jgi:hypothetical protein
MCCCLMLVLCMLLPMQFGYNGLENEQNNGRFFSIESNRVLVSGGGSQQI